MGTSLDDYKELIDAMAKLPPGVHGRWVREKRPWPELPENAAINSFLATLSDQQREVLATLLESAFQGGIHEVLVYLNDEIALRGLRLTRNGRVLPVEPFGTELYYDWVARLAEDDWPDPVDETLT